MPDDALAVKKRLHRAVALAKRWRSEPDAAPPAFLEGTFLFQRAKAHLVRDLSAKVAPKSYAAEVRFRVLPPLRISPTAQKLPTPTDRRRVCLRSIFATRDGIATE